LTEVILFLDLYHYEDINSTRHASITEQAFCMVLLCPGVYVMNFDLKKHNIQRARAKTRAFLFSNILDKTNMSINNTITTLQRDVIRAFATLDGWFDKEEGFHQYKPPGDGDHNTFHLATEKFLAVNTHLLSLINNGCREVVRQNKQDDNNTVRERFQELSTNNFPADYFLTQLHEQINITQGEFDLNEIREAFRDQLYRCLCQLELLKNGEGFLYRTHLTENDAHKMDIYQLIQLLSFNIWKNIAQLEKLETVYTGIS
jgi:hypothetical protein